MIYNSVSEIFDSIDGTRARLAKRVEGLSAEQENYSPSPDAWSVAQIIEHLSITEAGLARLFPLMIKKAEGAGVRRRQSEESFRPVALDHLVERSLKEKYTSPEAIRPTGSLRIADSLARLERSRASLHELRPQLESLDMTSMTYPHPAFGPLDLYQWLAFIGMHEERHLRQIERVMSSPEFKAIQA